MSSWNDIQIELKQTISPEKPAGDFDAVRRDKYTLVSKITERPLLVYATAFHNPIKLQLAQPLLSIDLSDKDGFWEIIDNIKEDSIDVFLHSPGGSPDATESIVQMLRKKFKNIRFIITGAAKSAATMLALSGDEILMSHSAELGPIDPQIKVNGNYSPAGSIKEQFERASEELKKNPAQLPVWIPILEKFAPALLVQCDNYLDLAKKLVEEWLNTYMFCDDELSEEKAQRIADYLANEKNTLSHGRRIGYDKLKEIGVKVTLLEDQDEKLQEAIKLLHHSIMATLDITGAVKIFENSNGGVLIRIIGQPIQNKK